MESILQVQELWGEGLGLIIFFFSFHLQNTWKKIKYNTGIDKLGIECPMRTSLD